MLWRKKRVTDAELQESKNEVKTIIKKIEKKLLLLSKLKVNQKIKKFLKALTVKGTCYIKKV